MLSPSKNILLPSVLKAIPLGFPSWPLTTVEEGDDNEDMS